MNTTHWIQHLPEAGPQADDIARRLSVALDALSEAQLLVDELECEADEFANDGTWSEAEIAMARKLDGGREG